MITIDAATCIGCGRCAGDCVNGAIRMTAGRPEFGGHCIECGHCVAICPTGAVMMPRYDMKEAVPLTSFQHTLSADALLGFIKARRTVRHFKDLPVEREKLMRILEAGRYTPTAANRQGNRYAVVTEQLEPLRRLLVAGLAEMGRATDFEKADAATARYARNFIAMEQNMDAHTLFCGAHAAIFVINDSLRDGALAASNMELMTYAEGLGMLYCGFATMAMEASKEAREMIGADDGKSVAACLLLGYPDVSYVRLPPRKKASVRWL